MFDVLVKSNNTYNENEKAIIYLGAISEDRGIVELVDSMSFLDNSFKLYIIGKWSEPDIAEKVSKSFGLDKS